MSVLSSRLAAVTALFPGAAEILGSEVEIVIPFEHVQPILEKIHDVIVARNFFYLSVVLTAYVGGAFSEDGSVRQCSQRTFAALAAGFTIFTAKRLYNATVALQRTFIRR